MMYDQFGADASFVPKIVDYAYNNFSDWYPDPEYFHGLDYEEKIALLEQNLDDLADHIYEYGDRDGLVGDLEMDVDAIYHLVALDSETRKEIATKLADKFYKASEGTVSKEATEYTEDEKAYMEYLDELYPDVPVSYGLLLYKGDPTAFQVGMRDWLSERGEEND